MWVLDRCSPPSGGLQRSRRILASHEAFALAFRPSERLFHRFALVESQTHLCQRCLHVDLLGYLRRRWRCCNRQLLVVEWIRVVVERAFRRAFLSPGLQGRKFFVCRKVIAAAGRDKLFDRRRLREVDKQALGGFLVLRESPDVPEEG